MCDQPTQPASPLSYTALLLSPSSLARSLQAAGVALQSVNPVRAAGPSHLPPISRPCRDRGPLVTACRLRNQTAGPARSA